MLRQRWTTYVCFVWTVYQARHLEGSRASQNTPTPPFVHKAEILPRQHHQPYCSNLQLKINKNPDLCLASRNAKFNSSIILQGV